MLQQIAKKQLLKVKDLLHQLRDKDYSRPLEVLHGSTLGMHFRHIVEFYQCLFETFEGGTVNYDHRLRDRKMELDKSCCEDRIDEILDKLETISEDRKLTLSANFSEDANGNDAVVTTTIYRELLYNVEHTVHHLAIIKIGLHALDAGIIWDENLGIAASTLRNKKACVQ